jgi:hypothetical protein
LAGSAPIEHLFPWLTGHRVNRGASKACALAATVAATDRAGTVLQTQTEIVSLPPGDVCDSCFTIRAVMQRAPDGWVCLCVGEGDGLGECECDGDGLGECDRDGLGECDGDGLGEADWDGLELVVEEFEVAMVGLGVGLDGLGLGDGEPVATSSTADVTAAEPPPPQAELVAGAAQASVGTTATPHVRKDPAAAAANVRPARLIPTRIVPPFAQPGPVGRPAGPSISWHSIWLKGRRVPPPRFLP